MLLNFKNKISAAIDMRIRYQLIVYSAISFIMVLSGFIFVADSFFNNLTTEVKTESLSRLTARLNTDIKSNLVNNNPDAAIAAIDRELLRGDIDIIIVTYVTGKNSGLNSKVFDTKTVIARHYNRDTKLIESFSSDIPAEDLTDSPASKEHLFYVNTVLVNDNNLPFANIEIFFNKTNISYITKISKFLIILILVANFLVCLFLTIKIFDKILVSRINQLQKALVSIVENKNSSVFLEIVEEDELGEVKKTINNIQAKMMSIINDKHTANDRLEQKVRETELLQKQIIQAEKIAGLGAIVGGVAHELNSPLSSVNVISETIIENIHIFKTHLSNECRREDVHIFIANIEEGINILYSANTKALQLIQEFKSAVSSQTDEQITKIQPQKFIGELMNLLKTTYPVTNIRATIDVDPDVKEIDTLRGCLFRVLTGLVSNVYVHAFPNGAKGWMKIAVKNIDEELLEISVADNGIGIREEYLDKVFDPFFTTSLNNKNQGLGLHLALTETIKNLKGTLSVAGGEGSGTVFTLIIPKKLVKQKP